MTATKGEELMEIASADFIEAESKISENINLVSQRDANQRTLLHWAALMGKERLVELLLSFDACKIDETDDTGATPLILATLKGSLQICKLLCERGADVNHCNANGHSPVKYACSKNHKELLVYLLERKGDPNKRDNFGEGPIHRAASMEHHDCLRILLNHSKSAEIIMINSQNKQGNTALHLACECDDATGAFLLIDHGASVEIINKEEKTPLQVCNPAMRRKILDYIESKSKNV